MGRSIKVIGIIASSALALSACADAAEDGGSAGGSFEFGAAQSEVNAAIEELEPVTLKFQPSGTSADSLLSYSANAYMEAVEERSEGKISFDVSWGRSIASYTEIDDALTDGRLDLAFSVPIYSPDEYPVLDALSKFTQYAPSSPYVGEAISDAMMSELAWGSDKLMAEYEDQGLTPLRPLFSAGAFHIVCNEPDTSLDDWGGRVVRAGNTTHTEMVSALGASPTFLEYEETYEALQRNTVDCTTANFPIAAPSGLAAVAPHLSYMTGSSIATTSTNALVAGSSFKDLPVAYQQILFDAGADHYHGNLQNVFESTVKMLDDIEAADGSVQPLDEEANEVFIETQREMVQAISDEGVVGDDMVSRAEAVSEKWADIVSDLDYEDGGELDDFREWYDSETVDMRSIGQRVIEEAGLPHRPQQ